MQWFKVALELIRCKLVARKDPTGGWHFSAEGVVAVVALAILVVLLLSKSA